MVRFEVCLCLLSPIPLAVPCVVLGVALFLVMFLRSRHVHRFMRSTQTQCKACLLFYTRSCTSSSRHSCPPPSGLVALHSHTLDGSTSMPLLRPIRPFETIPKKRLVCIFFAEFLEHFSERGQTCRVDWSTRAFFALFGRASRHERFKSTFEAFLNVGIDRFRRLRRTAAAKWRLVGRWVLPTGAGHTFPCIAKARRSRTRRE